MRIAVLGAGAMGSWFGGRLAGVGHEVQLLTTNVAHRDAVRAGGLRLREAAGERVQAVRIDAPEAIAGPVELVLLFTKAFRSDAAMASVAHALGADTLVLSLQNGLGNAEAIGRHVPLERVLIGNTMRPVDRLAPGVLASAGEGESWFGAASEVRGERAAGSDSPAVRAVLEAFAPTDLDLRHDADIHRRIWHKVAFNAGMNAPCALVRGTPGDIGGLDEARALAREIAREAVAVAAAEGVELDPDAVFATIDFACEHHGGHKPSMLQDLEAGRRTEIESLNGAVVERGERAGVATPLNRTLATLVRLAERSGRR